MREKLRTEFALTLPQFDVMAALVRVENGMTMTELSRHLMVSNGNVTGIIDRLVAEKLVLRTAPANDRRSFIVRLTPKGTTLFETAAKAHEGWINGILADIDGDEAERIVGDLDGLARDTRAGEKQP